MRVRPLADDERGWAAEYLVARWGSDVMVSRGVLHRPAELPGFVALAGGARVGLATYRIDGGGCELTTLDSEAPGAGTALLEAVAGAARAAGCRRLWLITTNDNTPALRFYQRRGLRLVALRAGALDESRRLKPEIPRTGLDGIPLRDELELQLDL